MQMTAFAQRFLDYHSGPNASAPMVTPEESARNFHKVRPLIAFSHRVMLRKFIENGCDYTELASVDIGIELEQVNA